MFGPTVGQILDRDRKRETVGMSGSIAKTTSDGLLEKPNHLGKWIVTAHYDVFRSLGI